MPNRRQFLQTSTATAAALAVAPQVHAGGSDFLKVGLVGCGGRGTGALEQALNADPYTRAWALADAFDDRTAGCEASIKAKFPDRCDVPAARRFHGLDGYKGLIDSGVDVVLLCATPAFRPAHLRYAVEKKKHVFCEKPMAVDAPGVRSVLETAKLAKAANLNIVSGFCYRYDLPKRATIAKIHDGAIGDVLAIHTTYLTGYLRHFERQPSWSDVEYQLRNWLYYNWLSGDHIVEQHIHSLDKASWVLKDALPLNAISLGGRQTRVEEKWGNVFDHFATVFEFPGGVKVFSFCRQVAGATNDVNDHVIATAGSAQIQKHTVEATNKDKWTYRGDAPNMYDQEHRELFAAIRNVKTINQGEQMAHSTMIGILGRMAGYTGKRVTWDQAFGSEENLMPPNLDMKAAMPVAPVPKPGRTTLR